MYPATSTPTLTQILVPSPISGDFNVSPISGDYNVSPISGDLNIKLPITGDYTIK